MKYHIVLSSDDELRPEANVICRVMLGDTLSLSVIAPLRVDAIQISYGSLFCEVVQLKAEPPFGTRSVDILCKQTGPMQLVLLSGDEAVGNLQYLVRSSIVSASEDLSLVSVITRKLGKLKDWNPSLQVLSRQKFSAIHFTPVQELGNSKSSYSIAEYLQLAKEFETDWDSLGEYLENTVLKKYGMFSFCDIVLNHIAESSPFIRAHPQVCYNEVNSPWLKGAIALDNLFKEFTQDIVRGTVRGPTKIGPSVHSPHDVDQICRVFAQEYLIHGSTGFNHRSWFTIDVHQTIENYKAYKAKGSCDNCTKACPDSTTSLSKIIDGLSSFTDAARRLVGESENFAIRGDIVAHFAHSERHARDLVAWAQQSLWEDSSSSYASCLDALKGTLTYERLTQKKGAITYEPWNSVVPWYFTSIVASETSEDEQYIEGHVYHLANNGWVMGWSSERGFIERGGNVYLKRSLVAWSDCVKLRYGEPRAERFQDCPVLWQLMADYAQLSAKTFHGFRLDNCHTTPKAVARFVLENARSTRPNLFVFAELFTGSEKADLHFEESLGLDALVREAIQTSSPGDEAYHAVKYSNHGRPFGQLDQNVILGRTFECEARRPLPGRSINIFYDCTHDNETCYQKSRPCDALASACIVTASGCAVGSTFGYEVLVKSNPTVHADGQLYPSKDYKLAQSDFSDQDDARKTKEVTYDQREGCTVIKYKSSTDCNDVQLWGAHNDWKSGCKMERHPVDSKLWYTYIETSKLSVGKFVIDGRWECSSEYTIVRDDHGNENNLLTKPQLSPPSMSPCADLSKSSGIIEARRLLNQIHAELSDYPEITIAHLADDIACISRFNPRSGLAYHFLVRSGWWLGNPKPGHDSCGIKGKLLNHGPILSARMLPEHFDHSHPWALAPTHSIVEVLQKSPAERYIHETDMTWLTLGQYFPSGTICVYQTCVDRADSAIERLITESGLLAGAAERVDLDLCDVNVLLWSCDQEERDRSNNRRGVYLFPGVPNVTYAGVMGVLDGMRVTRELHPNDYQSRGVYQNVVEGNWLMDYHLERIEEFLSDRAWFVDVMRSAHSLITNCRRSETKARAIEILFRFFYSLCHEVITSHSQIKTTDPVAVSLLVASTQLVGRVRTARMNEKVDVSISAGLPFFTTEFMREWGRDTMLSLFGLTAPLQRWDLAKASILCYARVIRHGMIPNLLDSSNTPRYNARDAVHFWLNALQRYVKFAPLGPDILNEIVYLKYNHGLEYDVPMLKHASDCVGKSHEFSSHEYCIPLRDCVRYVLYAHYHSINYREWNAGKRIDEQMQHHGFNVCVRHDEELGFCFGGNRLNCGTWMDKMGSSAKAGNKGIPASPRDGAPVELTISLYSTLCWVLEDSAMQLTTEERTIYTSWRNQIKKHFCAKYLVTSDDHRQHPRVAVEGTLKDTYGGQVVEEDFYVRCNYAVGLGLSLHPDLLPKCVAIRALKIAKERLVCEPEQVGMKTLCSKNPKYMPNYNNQDDGYNKETAHGWNYHQGPEWVWPYGYWCEAMWRYTNRDLKCAAFDSDPEHKCESNETLRELRNTYISTSLIHIARRLWSSPWYSLPEVTHANGIVCPDGCQAQAWSIAAFLSFACAAYYEHGGIKSGNVDVAEIPKSGQFALAQENVVPDQTIDGFDSQPQSKEDVDLKTSNLRSASHRAAAIMTDCNSPSPTCSIPRAADFILTDDEKGLSPEIQDEIHAVNTAEH